MASVSAGWFSRNLTIRKAASWASQARSSGPSACRGGPGTPASQPGADVLPAFLLGPFLPFDELPCPGQHP